MSCVPSSEPTAAYHSQVSQVHLSSSLIADLMGAVLDHGLPFRFQASGHSMSPFILDGDLITVAPFTDRPPSLGDVVAFILPGSTLLLIHRILALHASAYLIQGDNNPSGPDGEIPLSALIGRVIYIERHGRRIRFGLGPEHLFIAILSRHHLLVPLVQRLVRFKHRLWG